jgi:hypothetical protein
MLQATHDITDKLPLDKSVEGVVLQNETEIAKLSLARQESGGKMEQHPNKSKQIETNETNKTSGMSRKQLLEGWSGLRELSAS